MIRFLILTLSFVMAAGATHADEQMGGVRIAGFVGATIDADGHVTAQARGCAVFAADGRTCARAMTADTPLRVASISKLVTALGVMRMVEAGQLDLDRDVSLYLGYWIRNPAFPKTPVTLRQMMSHTSSLTDGSGYVFGLGARVSSSAFEPDRWDAAHAPGTYFHYSNYNFVLIGTIMEAVSGERFDRLMARLVLKPLDIEGCFNWAACDDATIAKAGVLYRTGEDETKFDPEGAWVAQVDDFKGVRPPCPVFRADKTMPCDLASIVPGVNGGLFSPQGGFRTTILGLAKIAQVLAFEGRGPRSRFLRRESVQALLTPVWRYAGAASGVTEGGSMCAYGLSTHLLATAGGPDCRDDLFGDGRARAGHIGEAYGLYGGVWVDRAAKRASLYLVSGSAAAPSSVPGAHSAFTRLEEDAADLTR